MKRTIWIHILVWGFMLFFPLLFYTPGDDMELTWGRVLRTAGSPISYMALFYINYLWLIPRKYFAGSKRSYGVYNALFIVLALAFVVLWWELTDHVFIKEHIRHHLRPEYHGPRPILPPPQQMLIFYNIISLTLTVGLSMALRLSERTKELEKERIEIESHRTEAELTNLRAQLNPHFLLNTLNNIYALISFDTEKAQHAVEELSKLLRYMLYDNQSNFVPLYKEVAFINNYIELMKMRVTGSVKVSCSIDVTADDATPVAPLLFISLIENAFKHGVSSCGKGSISIAMSQQDGMITCAIINSNHPKKSSDKSGSGIGLEQVARRLDLVYPGRYTWTRGVSDDGTVYKSILEIKV